MLKGLVPLFLVGLGAPSHAAQDFIEGVYLQSEELCAQAKKDGMQTVIEAGNIVLMSRGLESIEYNCEFLTITKSATSPVWAVTALCEQPGHSFPDILSIREASPGQLELVSIVPEEEGEDAGNSGSYVLCDGVAMP